MRRPLSITLITPDFLLHRMSTTSDTTWILGSITSILPSFRLYLNRLIYEFENSNGNEQVDKSCFGVGLCDCFAFIHVELQFDIQEFSSSGSFSCQQAFVREASPDNCPPSSSPKLSHVATTSAPLPNRALHPYARQRHLLVDVVLGLCLYPAAHFLLSVFDPAH